MRVREFMTTNVITVSSDTSVVDAEKFMKLHKVRRLPVMDKGQLVGVVSDRRVAQASPSAATSLSRWEINALMSKLSVNEIMKVDIVTVTPDTTAEAALDMAQENGVGALPIVDEKQRLVGIVTTNDFVYRIMNPLLGLGKPGVRLHIYDCGSADKIEKAVGAVKKYNFRIEAIHVDDSNERDSRDLIIQVDTKEPQSLINDLTNQGFKVEIRERKSWPIDES